MSNVFECWSSDNENFNADSLQELLENNDSLEPGATVYVGEGTLPTMSQLCDAEDVLDMMGDRAYDLVGEHADNYPTVGEEARKELNDFLQVWMTKHCLPNFWRVSNVREYVLTPEDLKS